MQTIELYDDPDYWVQVLLDGTLFNLLLSWNSEGNFWTMGIHNFDREPLVFLKLTANAPLLQRYRSEELPAGELIVLSDSSAIGRTDFADQYAKLVYITESEL